MSTVSSAVGFYIHVVLKGNLGRRNNLQCLEDVYRSLLTNDSNRGNLYLSLGILFGKLWFQNYPDAVRELLVHMYVHL